MPEQVERYGRQVEGQRQRGQAELVTAERVTASGRVTTTPASRASYSQVRTDARAGS
ncbi:hypothetical protein ABZ565_34525 [Streptomyces sp. NPDC016469]|uniref:hypothetical protein n=1 Tax=Streptomyces sp. NPDC016469 TaxID=3157191 RepID=UPI0033D202A1